MVSLSVGQTITLINSRHCPVGRHTCLIFIHNKYIHSSEMNNLNFLNPLNTWKYNMLTLTFKSIDHANFPSHLKFKLQKPSAFNLRSNNSLHLPNVLLDNSFYSTASTLFNALPGDIRNNSSSQNTKLFAKTVKRFLLSTQTTKSSNTLPSSPSLSRYPIFFLLCCIILILYHYYY